MKNPKHANNIADSLMSPMKWFNVSKISEYIGEK